MQVVGDSGWKRNQITNLGYQNYIVGSLGAIAGSSQVSYFALGTGGAPAASDTSLTGELTDAAGCRFTVTPSAVSSKTLQLTGSLASNVITANRSISNIGIFAVSTTAAGTLFAGNTFLYKRHSLEIKNRKLREFGETPERTIPSRAQYSKWNWEGVSTMYEVSKKDKDIVRSAWEHAELDRNDLTLEIGNRKRYKFTATDKSAGECDISNSLQLDLMISE